MPDKSRDWLYHQLAAACNVSRPVVRAAIVALDVQGQHEMKVGSGAFDRENQLAIGRTTG